MHQRIAVVSGDITQIRSDVIVILTTPVNTGENRPTFLIEQGAGQPYVSTVGDAIIIPAKGLPAEAIIHAVVPEWQGGDHQEVDSLARTYRSCLDLAAANGYRCIAFPDLPKGDDLYPPELAARVAWDVTYHYIGVRPLPENVLFVCANTRNSAIYQTIADSGNYQTAPVYPRRDA